MAAPSPRRGLGNSAETENLARSLGALTTNVAPGPQLAAPLRAPRAPGEADVFISHAGTEKNGVVSFLVAELQQRRINVFVDYGMKVGTDAPPEMLNTARSVLVGVAVLSVDFLTRKWPTDELKIFLERKRADPTSFHIVPYFYAVGAGDASDAVKAALNEEQYALLKAVSMFTGVEQFPDDREADNVKKLADHIESLLPPGRRRKTEDEEKLWEGYSVLPKNVSVAPSHLLRAGNAVVPFYGLEAGRILGMLQAWAQDTGVGVSARVVYGLGGAGKTRLALELCERMRALGYVAGFLPAPFDAAVVERLAKAKWPALIVIDYADNRVDLSALLMPIATMLANKSQAHFRLLLLSRGAGEWLTALQSSNYEIGGLLGTHEPLALEAAGSGNDRAEHFQHALNAFAVQLGQPPRQGPEPPLLDDPRFGRVLYIHLAALATQLGLPTEVDTLLDEIVSHEERGWAAKLVTRLGARLALSENALKKKMGLLVSATTLRGGARSIEELEAVVTTVWDRLPAELIESLCELLREFYPGQSAYQVTPLEPDLLGETLIFRTLTKLTPGRVKEILQQLFADNDQMALGAGFSTFARMSSDRDGVEPWMTAVLEPDVPGRGLLAVSAVLSITTADDLNTRMKGVHTRLGQVLARILERSETTDVASLIIDKIPKETVALREVALWASKVIAATTTAKVVESRDHANGLVGNVANVIADISALIIRSQRENSMGQLEQAFESAQKAVQGARQLDAGRPGQHHELLAASMSNLAGCQNQLGQPEAALVSSDEALLVRRMLVNLDRLTFLPQIAISLNNNVEYLFKIGNIEAAMNSALESVEIYRELVHLQPSDFQHSLAVSLSNLSSLQSKFGRLEPALKSALESTKMFRNLADARPDAVLPVLAKSLRTLGGIQSKVNQREEALRSLQESANIFRRLAQARPDAFLPSLATSLHSLGSTQYNLRKRKEAMESEEEATCILRTLAVARPDVFQHTLASSLSNLGETQRALGHYEQGLASALESVSIFRKLAIARPEAFLSELARSINNLSNMQSTLGKRKEALESALETTKLFRHLSFVMPEAFLPDLAKSLNNLGAMHGTVGQLKEALKSAEESIKIYRELSIKYPDVFRQELVDPLTILGVAQFQLGEHEGAMASYCEAIEITAALAKSVPNVYLEKHVKVVRELADQIHRQPASAAALASAGFLVRHLRLLAQVNPPEFRPRLTTCLAYLAACQEAAGHVT